MEEFCHYFNICLTQIGPIVWREVAYLRYLSNLVSVNFTFCHLLHLYSPKIFHAGIFTLSTHSKRIIVNLQDDQDHGWYYQYVVIPTHELVEPDNCLFPDKWNYIYKSSSILLNYLSSIFLIVCSEQIFLRTSTIEVFRKVPDFYGWISIMMSSAPMEHRRWKFISKKVGWNVKTDGKFLCTIGIFLPSHL